MNGMIDRGPRGGRPAVARTCAVGAWAAAVAVGLGLLQVHAAGPGSAGDPPPAWPSAGRLAPSAVSPTLVLFLAKACPCAGASLAGLERLLARAPGPIDAALVVAGPGPSPWEGRDLPGVRVLDDESGAEAARFGVATSGHALLFGPGGRRLLFSGGLTPARGHEGDSDGAESVLRLAAPGATTPRAPAVAPVFGCPMPLASSGD